MSPKLLNVEDNATQHKYIDFVLKKQAAKLGIEYEMFHSITGKQGVALAEKHADKLDLIIMDFHLPDINGDIATIEIRDLNILTPVILHSADIDKECYVVSGVFLSFHLKPLTATHAKDIIHCYARDV